MTVSDEIDQIVKQKGLSTKNSDFLLILQDTISSVKKALEERKNGVSGDGSSFELEEIYNELLKIEDLVKADKIPPAEERYVKTSRIILESPNWPPTSELGEKISRISFVYKHTLNG